MGNGWYLSKVSTKQDEIGIGQWGIQDHTIGDEEGFDLEFLPWMYSIQNILLTPKEKPILSYLTFATPLSWGVWAWTLAAIFAVLIILIIMEKIWSYASEEPVHPNFLFQGSSCIIYSRSL